MDVAYEYITGIFSTTTSTIDTSFLDRVVGIILLFLIVLTLYLIVAELIRRKRFVYYRVIPHREDDASIKEIKSMMIAFHNIRHKRIVRWLLRHDWKSMMFYRDKKGKYYYYVGMDKALAYQVERSFKLAHNRCHFTQIDKDKVPLPNKRHIGARLVLRKKFNKTPLPLAEIKEDVLSNFIYNLPEAGWLKVDLRAEKEKDLSETISEAEEDYKEKTFRERSGVEKSELRSLQQRFQTNEVSFLTYISLATETQNGVDKLKSLSQLIKSKMNYENELLFRKFRDGVKYYPRRVGRFLVPDGGKMVTTGSEIANIFHLPNYSETNKYVVEKITDDTELYDETIELLDEGIFNHDSGVSVGYAELSDGTEREIKVRIESLKDHAVVTGKTGSGKSSFIVAIIDGLMKGNVFNHENYAGLTFLDPGRDTALTLYNRLLKYEKEGADIDWKKVNYIPLKKTDFPLALNLLDKNVEVAHSEIADSVTNIIEEAVEDKAPIAERLMKKAIETLLADDRPHNILEVAMLINQNDTAYRDEILKRVKKNPANYDIINYWEQDAEQNIKTSGVALKNRIDVINESPILKNVFGQTDNEFDFNKMLDEGHINLIDLSGMRDSELKIISGYISFRMYTASLGRDAKSRFHLLAFDETKTMGNLEYVTRIVAETRKFNLATLVGSQTFGQLNRDMKRALKDVQDNFISLLQGSSEADEVASFLSDGRVEISAKDLTSLDSTAREGYIALKDVPSNSNEESRYTVKVKIDPLTKYNHEGLPVEYKSEDEKRAIDWSEEIANLNRIHYTGVKHKEEVAFELMKTMQPYKRFNDEDFYRYTNMTKEEMYEINEKRGKNQSEKLKEQESKQLKPLNQVSDEEVVESSEPKDFKKLTPINQETEELNEEKEESESNSNGETVLKTFNDMGLSYLSEDAQKLNTANEEAQKTEKNNEEEQMDLTEKDDSSQDEKPIKTMTLKEIKQRRKSE